MNVIDARALCASYQISCIPGKNDQADCPRLRPTMLVRFA